MYEKLDRKVGEFLKILLWVLVTVGLVCVIASACLGLLYLVVHVVSLAWHL
jgi:hypothetical protein